MSYWSHVVLLVLVFSLATASLNRTCCSRCPTSHQVVFNNCSFCGNNEIALFAGSTIELACYPCETEPTPIEWWYSDFPARDQRPKGHSYSFTVKAKGDPNDKVSVHCGFKNSAYSGGASLHVLACDLEKIDPSCSLSYRGELRCSWLLPEKCNDAVFDNVSIGIHGSPQRIVDFGCVARKVSVVYQWLRSMKIIKKKDQFNCSATAFITPLRVTRIIDLKLTYTLNTTQLGVFQATTVRSMNVLKLLTPAKITFHIVPSQETARIEIEDRSSRSKMSLAKLLRLNVTICYWRAYLLLNASQILQRFHPCPNKLSFQFSEAVILRNLIPNEAYEGFFRFQFNKWKGLLHNFTFNTKPALPQGVVGGIFFAPTPKGISMNWTVPENVVTRGPSVFYTICAGPNCVDTSVNSVIFSRSGNTNSSFLLIGKSINISFTIGNALGMSPKSSFLKYLDEPPAEAFRVWKNDVCLLEKSSEKSLANLFICSYHDGSASCKSNGSSKTNVSDVFFRPISDSRCAQVLNAEEDGDGTISFLPLCDRLTEYSVAIANSEARKPSFAKGTCQLTVNVGCDKNGSVTADDVNGSVLSRVSFRTVCYWQKLLNILLITGLSLLAILVLAILVVVVKRNWNARKKRTEKKKRPQKPENDEMEDTVDERYAIELKHRVIPRDPREFENSGLGSAPNDRLMDYRTRHT